MPRNSSQRCRLLQRVVAYFCNCRRYGFLEAYCRGRSAPEKETRKPVSNHLPQEKAENATSYWKARLFIEAVKAAVWVIFEYIHDFGTPWRL